MSSLTLNGSLLVRQRGVAGAHEDDFDVISPEPQPIGRSARASGRSCRVVSSRNGAESQGKIGVLAPDRCLTRLSSLRYRRRARGQGSPHHRCMWRARRRETHEDEGHARCRTTDETKLRNDQEAYGADGGGELKSDVLENGGDEFAIGWVRNAHTSDRGCQGAAHVFIQLE